jgi:HEAT repeat protein
MPGNHFARQAPEHSRHVAEAYAASNSRDVRVALVEVVGTYRVNDSAEFLGTRLTEDDEDIWQAAIDGLIALGGDVARDVLERRRSASPPDKASWITEALDLIEDRGDRTG